MLSLIINVMNNRLKTFFSVESLYRTYIVIRFRRNPVHVTKHTITPPTQKDSCSLMYFVSFVKIGQIKSDDWLLAGKGLLISLIISLFRIYAHKSTRFISIYFHLDNISIFDFISFMIHNAIKMFLNFYLITYTTKEVYIFRE